MKYAYEVSNKTHMKLNRSEALVPFLPVHAAATESSSVLTLSEINLCL